MQTGTGKRTVRGTKKYRHGARQRRKNKDAGMEVKQRETKSMTEQGKGLSNIYDINIEYLFNKRKTRVSEAVKGNGIESTQDKKGTQKTHWTQRRKGVESWI